jgi:hypothetical protein
VIKRKSIKPFPTPGKFTDWRSVKAIWLAFLLSLLAHAGLLFYKNPLPDRGRLWVSSPPSTAKRLSILTTGQTAPITAKHIHVHTSQDLEKIPRRKVYAEAPDNSNPTPHATPHLQWEDYLSNDVLSVPAEIIANPSLPEPTANVKQGRAQIIFLINKTGEIDSILVGENTIDPEYFEVMKTNLSKLRFRPGVNGDTPTNSRFTMEIEIAP